MAGKTALKSAKLKKRPVRLRVYRKNLQDFARSKYWFARNKFPSIIGESFFLYALAREEGYTPGPRAGVNAGCK